MGVRERTGMRAAGDEAGEVRHVDHELGADFVGDLAEAAEVDNARIGRTAGDDHLGLVLPREPGHLVHVDAVVVAAHAVRHRLEPLARHVHRRAVGEVPAGGEVETHEGVAGRHQRHERRDVGGGARVRLDVCEFTSEKLGNPFNRQTFRDVDVLAAAVIAPARQTLGILVGEDRTLGFEHRAADDVLRGDQLDLIALARRARLDRFGDFGSLSASDAVNMFTTGAWARDASVIAFTHCLSGIRPPARGGSLRR